MKLSEVIDELYPLKRIRKDEIEEGDIFNTKLDELLKKQWIKTPLEDFDNETLLRLFEKFIKESQSPPIMYKDYWINAIKLEIFKRLENQHNKEINEL